jgi:hypothetical protein
LPLGSLYPSPLNPRKTKHNPAALAALSDSIVTQMRKRFIWPRLSSRRAIRSRGISPSAASIWTPCRGRCGPCAFSGESRTEARARFEREDALQQERNADPRRGTHCAGLLRLKFGSLPRFSKDDLHA